MLFVWIRSWMLLNTWETSKQLIKWFKQFINQGRRLCNEDKIKTTLTRAHAWVNKWQNDGLAKLQLMLWNGCFTSNRKLAHVNKLLIHNFTHWGRDNISRYVADGTSKCIFSNQNVRMSFNISLKFVPKGPINNFPGLVLIMAWHQTGDKTLSEP